MIDRIYTTIMTRNPHEPDANYNPDQVVVDEKFTEVGSDELAVVIPPWHRARFIQAQLGRRLNRAGIDTLDYDFNSSILEADIDRVRESVFSAADQIVRSVKLLQEERRYQRVHLLTMSLGSITQSLVARDLPEFETATFIATGDNLASGLWFGQRTTRLRENFEQQGVNYGILAREWKALEPAQYTHVFRDKSVYFIASQNDAIVPSVDQRSFIRGLIESGAEVTFKYSNLGHLLTPGAFCLAGDLETALGRNVAQD